MTPVRKRAVFLCVVATGLAVGGLLLLGLPGALMMEIATPLVGLFGAASIGGDRYWPAAIMLTIVGPFALPPSYLAAVRLAPASRTRVGVTVGLATVANIALAVLVVVAGGH